MEQKRYKAACYCRLSDDDLNDGMSVSIETQITIQKQYCRENQIQIVDFYCDDGYTGTTKTPGTTGKKVELKINGKTVYTGTF